MRDFLMHFCCGLCALVQEARVRSLVYFAYHKFLICNIIFAGIESPWKREYVPGINLVVKATLFSISHCHSLFVCDL